MRYIAHEVRTPLNTAVMGLQVLAEGMQYFNPEEEMETMTEVRDSCDIAVNVLNELLTFDKLQSKTLLLEKSTVEAWELIEKSIKPFHSQVF